MLNQDKLSIFFDKTLKLLANEIIFGVVNLATAIIIARQLGPELFGFWGIIMVILLYGESLGRLKVDVASIYIAGNSKYSANEIIAAINWITIVSSFVVILIFFLVSEYIFSFLFSGFQDTKIEILPFICITFLCQNFFLNYQYIYLAMEDSLTYGLANVSKSLCFFILIIILTYMNNLTIQNILIAASFAPFFVFAFLFCRFHYKEGLNYSAPNKLYEMLIKRGFQYYLVGITSSLCSSASILIASQQFNPAGVGVFTVAKNLSELFYSRVGGAFNTITYTTISNLDDGAKEKISLTFQIFLRVLIGFIIIYAAMFFLWEPIITFFYGKQYILAPNLILIMSLGYLSFYAVQIIINYFYGVGKESLLKYLYLIGFVLQISIIFFYSKKPSLSELSVITATSFSIVSLLVFLFFLYERIKNK